MNGIDEGAGFPSETRGVCGNVRGAVLVVSERHDQGTESIVGGRQIERCMGEWDVVRNQTYRRVSMPAWYGNSVTTNARTVCQDGK